MRNFCTEMVFFRPLAKLLQFLLLNPFQLALKSLACIKTARSCVTLNLHLMMKLKLRAIKIKYYCTPPWYRRLNGWFFEGWICLCLLTIVI
jgi:hypothetical protein